MKGGKKKGKKREKKKRKIPRSEARLFQRYTGISPSESYGAQIRYTISNSLDSDTRLGSQIQSTAATTSLLPPRFKVTSHRAAILFRVSKLFTRLHRNSGRFLCNFWNSLTTRFDRGPTSQPVTVTLRFGIPFFFFLSLVSRIRMDERVFFFLLLSARGQL